MFFMVASQESIGSLLMVSGKNCALCHSAWCDTMSSVVGNSLGWRGHVHFVSQCSI